LSNLSSFNLQPAAKHNVFKGKNVSNKTPRDKTSISNLMGLLTESWRDQEANAFCLRPVLPFVISHKSDDT